MSRKFRDLAMFTPPPRVRMGRMRRSSARAQESLSGLLMPSYELVSMTYSAQPSGQSEGRFGALKLLR